MRAIPEVDACRLPSRLTSWLGPWPLQCSSCVVSCASRGCVGECGPVCTACAVLPKGLLRYGDMEFWECDGELGLLVKEGEHVPDVPAATAASHRTSNLNQRSPRGSQG